MIGYLYLAITIAAEILATASLKASHGFTRLWPSLVVVLGYGISFYTLSHVLEHIPLSVTYATWSAVGTAATALIGYLVWHEAMNPPKIAGLVLIIVGVALLNK